MKSPARSCPLIAQCAIPNRIRCDDGGVPRLETKVQTFEGLLEAGFGRIRFYAAQDLLAGRAFLDCLERLAQRLSSAERELVVLERARLLAFAEQALGRAAFEDLRSAVRAAAHGAR